MLVLIAALAQAFALLKHPRQNKSKEQEGGGFPAF